MSRAPQRSGYSVESQLPRHSSASSSPPGSPEPPKCASVSIRTLPASKLPSPLSNFNSPQQRNPRWSPTVLPAPEEPQVPQRRPSFRLKTPCQWAKRRNPQLSNILSRRIAGHYVPGTPCYLSSGHSTEYTAKIRYGPGSAPLNFPASNAAFASSNVRTRQCSFVGISLAIPQHDSGEHSGELLT